MKIKKGDTVEVIAGKDRGKRGEVLRVAPKDNRVVVLRGVDGQNITIPRDQIEEMIPQKKSLMPEGLLKPLTPDQVRDLFAYLRSSQPLNN